MPKQHHFSGIMQDVHHQQRWEYQMFKPRAPTSNEIISKRVQ
ncbi:hypothetical protein GMES_3451 [Paraglaciecola mesophila KMM 241]|uniref:Uncharacterized protein n=1 Tax=Paraglaciecola mesophila KMM 241 TaxID=1128912 RepID=K6Z9S8_9ALTE|nr:hypothetical protein GMES_3451 [Paraglaciecola mesophila KMM 241]